MSAADTGLMGMRGRTTEQKNIIRYFKSTGILGLIFRISDATFDQILNTWIHKCRSWIAERAQSLSGVDADEIKEIPPFLVENYYPDSRFIKMFRDHTFRASEYQMSCFMFSDKQIYIYNYIFDLTSANTTEQTREYSYEDITDVEVTKKVVEFANPRSLQYLLGGIAAILLGLVMTFIPGVGWFFLLAGVVTGIVLIGFLGYTRSTADYLSLRLTVPGDEFICAIKAENINTIQSMKAKIREKKK